MADTATLQAHLAKLEAAKYALLAGAKAEVVMYEGRRVEYTPAKIGDLNAAILELQQQLGLGRRRAIAIGTGPR